MDYRGIAGILSIEHPQTIAVALSRLEPEVAGEIVRFLPQETQIDVITRIARIDQIPPDIIAEIDAMMAPLLK